MKKFFLKDYSKATANKSKGAWVIPLKPADDGLNDLYFEDGIMYKDCVFCGHQNLYEEWVCNRCGAI